MADESVLEVVIKMREEGESTLQEIKDQLKEIKDALKDLQDQAKDTNSTLRDTAAQATATQMAFSFMADETNKLKTAQKDFNDEASRTNGVLKEHQSSIDAERKALQGMAQDYKDAKLVTDALGGAVGVTGAQFEKFAAQVFDTDEQLLQDRDQMNGMKQAMKDSRDAASALGATLGVTGAEFQKIAEEVFTMTEAESRQKEASDQLLKGFRDSQSAASILGATIGVTGAEFERLAQDVFSGKDAQDAYNTSQDQATTAQKNAGNAAKTSIPIIGGLAGALAFVGIAAGITIPVLILFGPILAQVAGSVIVTTAYLAGLVVVLATFTAGLVGSMILLAATIGLLGGMAAAVVYLGDRLFTTGEILTDPLLGLENNLNKMADTWGQKALPMANQIISWLNTLIPIAQKAGNTLLDWFGSHLDDLLSLASIIVGQLSDSFGKLWNDVKPLIDYMIATAPVWTQLMKLMLELANSAIVWLIQQLIRLQAWFTQELPVILPIVTGIFGAIGQAVDGLSTNIGKLVDWFTERLPKMAPIANSTFGAIGTIIQWVGQQTGNLIDWFINNWPQITKDANDLWSAFADGWSKTGPDLQQFQAALKIMSTLIDDMQHHTQLLHDVMFLLGLVIGFVINVLLALSALFLLIVDAVGHVITWFHNWHDAVDAVGNVINAVVSAIQTLITWIGNLRNSGIAAFLDAISGGLASVLQQAAAARAASGGGGGGGGGGGVDTNLTFQEGGTVPGPTGKAQMAIVHGGEVVLSNDRQNDIVNLLASIDNKLSGALFPTTAYGRV